MYLYSVKKNLFIILALSIFLQGFSQSEKGNDYKELKGRIEAIEKTNQELHKVNDSLIDILINKDKDSFKLNAQIKLLDSSLSTTNQRINDERLQKSLDAAENTVKNQDTLINSFAVIYTIISIAIVLLTIGLPIVLNLVSIRPFKEDVRFEINKVQDELKSLNDLKNHIREKELIMDKLVSEKLMQLDKEKKKVFEEITKDLENRFQEFLQKSEQDRIKQALINLESEESDYQEIAISHISLTPGYSGAS